MKNFSNTLVVLVTTISAPEAQTEMIVYTFLLPGKNDLYKAHFLPEAKKVCFVPSNFINLVCCIKRVI